MPELNSHVIYPDIYKDQLFMLWYRAGRPSVNYFYNMLDPEEDGYQGQKPVQTTLDLWIRNDFRPKADEMDAEASLKMREQLVAEKVEMLKRHAKLGLRMQDIASTFLEENAESLTASAAVRLLVEGYRIERESVGIPAMLKAIQDTSDEDLLDEIQEIMSHAPVEMLDE